MAYPVKVKRWGGSVAVVVPRRFAETHGIRVGTTIDLESIRVMSPKRRRYRLSELMSGYKPKHRHGEWKSGGCDRKRIAVTRLLVKHRIAYEGCVWPDAR